MIRLAGDDPLVQAHCLAGLNQAFPGWGGQDCFDWCYRRASDPRPADVLVSEAGGRVVAGLSAVYRWIARGDEPRERLALMGGAWTSPEARGRGHFSRLLEQMLETARARGATTALALVTGERGSLGVLAARCDRVVEAGFFTRPSALPPGPLRVEDLDPVDVEAAAHAFASRRDQAGGIRIVHSPATWRDQMTGRSAETRIVRLPGGTLAALGRFGDGWGLLDVLPFAPGEDSGLDCVASLYTTDPMAISALAAAGWICQQARVFQFVVAGSRYGQGTWMLAGGDRM